MIIEVLLAITATSFAQAQSTVDQRVNEHMQQTNKRIEIEGDKKEVELKKQAPRNLQPEAPIKRKTPFIVNPKKDPKDDTVFKDQYDHNNAKDPSTEFEQEITEKRDAPSQEQINREYIRQFQENAEKAGVKVQIDPKTLKARPVDNSQGTN
jgi:hypothetical protein